MKQNQASQAGADLAKTAHLPALWMVLLRTHFRSLGRANRRPRVLRHLSDSTDIAFPLCRPPGIAAGITLEHSHNVLVEETSDRIPGDGSTGGTDKEAERTTYERSDSGGNTVTDSHTSLGPCFASRYCDIATGADADERCRPPRRVHDVRPAFAFRTVHESPPQLRFLTVQTEQASESAVADVGSSGAVLLGVLGERVEQAPSGRLGELLVAVLLKLAEDRHDVAAVDGSDLGGSHDDCPRFVGADFVEL